MSKPHGHLELRLAKPNVRLFSVLLLHKYRFLRKAFGDVPANWQWQEWDNENNFQKLPIGGDDHDSSWQVSQFMIGGSFQIIHQMFLDDALKLELLTSNGKQSF